MQALRRVRIRTLPVTATRLRGLAGISAVSIALLLDFQRAFARIHLFHPGTGDGFHWRFT